MAVLILSSGSSAPGHVGWRKKSGAEPRAQWPQLLQLPPEQEPHEEPEEELFIPSPLKAKAEAFRETSELPQNSQAGVPVADMPRTSFSNTRPQRRHSYS